jgi:sulfite reductase (ferredoxin)
VTQFRQRFCDTELFFSRDARGKFAQYLFGRHQDTTPDPDEDSAHQLIEEAQLFIEAAQDCDAHMAGATTGGVNV